MKYNKDYIVQSILIKNKNYSLEQAIEWVLTNGYKVKKVDETKKFYRFRQITPSIIKKKGYIHFITKKIDKDIDLIIAYNNPNPDLTGGAYDYSNMIIPKSGPGYNQKHAGETEKRHAKGFWKWLFGGNLQGGALSSTQINDFIKASYEKNRPEMIDGYSLDKELSKPSVAVYHNKDNGRTVLINRGTVGTLSDWSNNLAYAVGAYKLTPRFKEAERVQKRTEEKYGAHTISQLSHSQGAVPSRYLGHNVHERITVNPAYKGEHIRHNEYVVKSENDPVSVLLNKKNPKVKKNQVMFIPNEGINPLTEHSPSILDRISDQMIGKPFEEEIETGTGRKIKKKYNKKINPIQKYLSTL